MAFKVPEHFRVRIGPMASTEENRNNGAFIIGALRILASDGLGWDHVSISLEDRCPTWQEMCSVKELFWDDEDCVMQLHPPRSEYINCHPYCLHLWRPHNKEILRPPSILVGYHTS